MGLYCLLCHLIKLAIWSLMMSPMELLLFVCYQCFFSSTHPSSQFSYILLCFWNRYKVGPNGLFLVQIVVFLPFWNTVSIVSKKLNFFKFMSKLAKYIGILNSVYSMQVLSWSKLGIYWNFILFQQNFNNLKKSTD